MIRIYDRKEKKLMEERVVGEKFLKLLYERPYGRPLLFLIRRKFFSTFYGRLMDTRRSRGMIGPFIRDHGIAMEESMVKAEDFTSFNDFFRRQLKPSARPFDPSPHTFPSPADSRLLAFTDISIHEVIQVKGLTYSLKELLKNPVLAENYQGGTVLVFRLNPLDYHRFHFVDEGIPHPSENINGFYYSVNPMALKTIPRVYLENKRAITRFDSRHFGTLLYVEVGATNVGTIIQTHEACLPVKKGSEKGYFEFGGSTVILFVEKGRLTLHEDILKASKEGIETRVLCGETIGEAVNSETVHP